MDAKSAMLFDDGEWPAIREPLTEPSDLCGSQRKHEPHDWTGQTTGKKLNCPGYPIRTAKHPKRKQARVRAA
jgi:hypothetical protein